MSLSVFFPSALRPIALAVICCAPVVVYGDKTELESEGLVVASRHVLDWVPLSALNVEQRAALPPGSCGAYIAPIRDDLEATMYPDAAPLRALSDRSLVDDSDPAGAKVLLMGDVLVQQGYRQIKAQRAELDQPAGTLTAEGPIEIREPGILILGDRTVVTQKNDVLVIEEGTFVIHPANTRGSARKLTKTGIESLVLEGATFTRCEPDNNAWVLKGSKITLDFDARQGYATNVHLDIRGIPVFYFPYLRFPLGNQRLSGFLAPSFEFSEDGYRVSIPYYFNLAPHYDLLWTAHSIEQSGLLNEWNARHLSRDFYTQLNMGYLSKDRGVPSDSARALIDAGELTAAEAVPFKGEERWVFNVDQVGGEGKSWSTNIDYTKVSDVNYFRDFSETGIADSADNHVDQKISAAYRVDHWDFSIEALQYQTLSDNIAEPYQQLPELVADGDYQWDRWTLSLANEWIRFDHKDASAAEPIITGDRLRLDYDLSWSNTQEWGFIKPSLLFKHLSYQLQEREFVSNDSASSSFTVPQLSVDTGLVFERQGGGYLQTFEPRLFYFTSPYRDHSDLFDLTSDGRDVDFDTATQTFNYDRLFKTTRFSGGDRIDDANQLSIGLTTRFLGNESGREWLSASAGQIFYFADRRVTLDNQPQTEERSDIAVKLRARPMEAWELSSDIIYDQALDEVNTGNLGLTYTSAYNNLFDANYRYVRGSDEDTRQINASIIAPLFSHQWHLLWHGAYDITQERELDLLTAVEYNGCCYSVRLGYRHWLDNTLVSTTSDVDLQYDWQTFFEVHFYGLGGVSEKLDTLFDEKIDGYNNWKATHSKE